MPQDSADRTVSSPPAAGDACQKAEAVKTTKRSPPSKGWEGTAGPTGARRVGALANPELFTGPPGWALRRHRNVTKDRARGFGPALTCAAQASSPPHQSGGLSLRFGRRGRGLALALRPMVFRRRRRRLLIISGGPPLVAPSLKVLGNSGHNPNSGFAVPPRCCCL